MSDRRYNEKSVCYDKNITDKINKISKSRGHNIRWIVSRDPSKFFVVNSLWLNKDILSVTFGRVFEDDLFWLTVHELCHYEVAPDHLKQMDNFGMPCDDVFVNKQTGLTHEESIVFEEMVLSHVPNMRQYLSEIEYEKLLNFKY
jgi:hypothetical protein